MTLAGVNLRDLFANRPAAGIAGRSFFATDTNTLYRDNGSTWDFIATLTVGGVSVKSSAYTLVATDNLTIIVANSSSAITLTLPAVPPSATWNVEITNIGLGTCTVARNGLHIDGVATNITLTTNQGLSLSTDEANYFTMRGLGSGLILKTNDAPNTSQSVLNLIPGANVTLTADASGGVTVASTGGSGRGAGSLDLLEVHSAGSSAELDFTAWYSTNYDEYRLEFINLLPSVNGVSLLVQFSTDGGTSYDSRAVYEYGRFYRSSSNTDGGSSADVSASGLPLWVGDLSNSTANSNGLCGSMRLFQPGSSLFKIAVWDTYSATAGGVRYYIQFGGQYRGTSSVNALRIIASSGNVTSGSVRVYGVRKVSGGASSTGAGTFGRALTIPVPAEWSWVTQGTATLDTTNNQIGVVTPSGYETWRMVQRDIPSPGSDWTATYYIMFSGIVQDNFISVGIGVKETGSTGKFLIWKIANSQGCAVTTYNGIFGGVSNVFGPLGMATGNAPGWYRIRKTGTNFYFEYGINGTQWLTLFTYAVASWVASPTQVTFGVCGSATYGMAASMASFDIA